MNRTEAKKMFPDVDFTNMDYDDVVFYSDVEEFFVQDNGLYCVSDDNLMFGLYEVVNGKFEMEIVSNENGDVPEKFVKNYNIASDAIIARQKHADEFEASV